MKQKHQPLIMMVLVVIATLSGVLLVLLGRFLIAQPETAIDFPRYFRAATAYLHGQSPYTPGHELEYLYPPAFLALVVPFTLLPLGPALIVWDVIQAVLVGFTLVLTLRDRLPAQQLALLLAVFPLWFPAFMWLRFGQVAGVLLIGWLMFGHNWRRGNDFSAGLWLATLAIKPPLLLVPLCLLVYLHKGRILAGVLVGGVAWLLASVAMCGPEGLVDYVRTLTVATSAQSIDVVYRTSTYSWGSIANMFPSQGWQVLFALGAATIVLVVLLSRNRPLEDILAVASPAMLLASPHVLVYDLLPLLATLPVLLRQGRVVIGLALVVAFVVVPLAHSLAGMPQIVSVSLLCLMLAFRSDRKGGYKTNSSRRAAHQTLAGDDEP